MGIAKALKTVQEKINNSAAKTGRNPDEIKLVAVTKTVELQRIVETVKAGVSILGENRVQEAKNKITEFRTQINPPIPPLVKSNRLDPEGGVEWHLIGSLQKNKAKTAVQLFDLIHSLDSASLAEELNKYSQQTGKEQRVLVQVQLSDEVTKHGVLGNDLMDMLERVADMNSLKLEGLMTIPPFFDDPEKTRPYFMRLRRLAKKASEKGFPINELSMGMSNDFEVAIEEGATMVRIGAAIFGERPK